MLTSDACRFQNCSQPVWTDTDYCQNHHPNKKEFIISVRDAIAHATGPIERRNWCGIDLSDMDISDKDFRYCCFSRSCFSRANFGGSQFLMCMIDGIEAIESQFTSVHMLSTFAAGSNFSRSHFIESEIINTNFNGIVAVTSIFDRSDLSYDRFIRANLLNAQFNDCNLRNVEIIDSNLENVVFTDSNPEDAFVFSRGKHS